MKSRSRSRGRENLPVSPSVMSRRNFLLASIPVVLAGVSLAAYELLQPRKLEQGEVAFNNFPNNISAAEQPKKYPASAAKRCLVHIRFAHGHDPKDSFVTLSQLFPSGVELSEEDKKMMIALAEQYLSENMKQSQQDCITIVRDLHQRGVLTGIHLEGKTDEEALAMQQMQNFNVRLNKLREKLAILNNQMEEPMQPAKTPSDSARDLLDSYLLESDIKILAAEKSGFDHGLEKALTGEESIDAFIEPREQALVERLGTREVNEYECVCFAFGADHDFRDQVEIWNRNNPNNQSCLVVITPIAHARIDEASKHLGECFLQLQKEMQQGMPTKERYIHWWKNSFGKAYEILKTNTHGRK